MQRFGYDEERARVYLPVTIRDKIKTDATRRRLYLMEYITLCASEYEQNHPLPVVVTAPNDGTTQ